MTMAAGVTRAFGRSDVLCLLTFFPFSWFEYLKFFLRLVPIVFWIRLFVRRPFDGSERSVSSENRSVELPGWIG